MRVKLFTFRFSPTLGAFDDTPLTDFVRDKKVPVEARALAEGRPSSSACSTSSGSSTRRPDTKRDAALRSAWARDCAHMNSVLAASG